MWLHGDEGVTVSAYPFKELKTGVSRVGRDDMTVRGLPDTAFASKIRGLFPAGHDCAPSCQLIQTCGARHPDCYENQAVP